jgi:tetratricopeptide (TPR) repeat protein
MSFERSLQTVDSDHRIELQLSPEVRMRKHHSSPLAVAALAAALVATPAPAFSQQQSGTPAGRMEVTTTSEVARAEYRQLVIEFFNLHYGAARAHALKALAADPNLGLATVFLARPALSPELSAAEREAQMSRGIASLANASAPEILLAVYTREVVAGRTQSANQVLKALAALAPNDADMQFAQHVTQRNAATTPAEALRIDREFLARFPDYGPAHNLNAYTLFVSGDSPAAYAAVERYVRLAPEQPNAHDTWADLLVLEGRYDEAIAHTQASMKLDSTWVQGPLKIGAIKLVTSTPDEARSWFARARDIAPSAAGKIDVHYWVATSYVMRHDVKSAMRELTAIGDEVAAAKLPAAAAALVHQRMAVVEATIGNKQNVAPHLAKGAEIGGANTANQTAHAVLAYAAIGDASAAQTNADLFAKAAPTNQFQHTLNALAAITAKDYAKAEGELAQSLPADLLAQELRAEVLKQHGKTAEARVIRDVVLKRPPKADGGPGVDVGKLVARLRAEKI